MVAKQDWLEAYKELCVILEAIPEVKHIDLWHEQIDYLPEEYPWPSGSIFIEFNTNDIETTGLKVQDINAEIDIYFCLDTLADSYNESTTQAIALAFGAVLKKIHKALQGVHGLNFSTLDRRSLRRVSAPQYLMVYKQTYKCIIRDQSAMDEYEDREIKKVSVTPIAPVAAGNNSPLFTLPT